MYEAFRGNSDLVENIHPQWSDHKWTGSNSPTLYANKYILCITETNRHNVFYTQKKKELKV